MSNNWDLPEADEADSNKITKLSNQIAALIQGASDTLAVDFPSNANYTPTYSPPLTPGVMVAWRLLVTSTFGSLTLTKDLILPLKKKAWVISNNTTGARPIRVIGATGAGVTIPNGQTAIIACDGTNFNLVGFMPSQPAGYAILNFAADSLSVSPGTTYFAWVNFITTVAATAERWLPIPKGGKLSNLRVICAIAPAGGSAGVTFTVRKKTAGGGTGAGTDTALTCTMAIGATLAVDTTNIVDVADGDEVSVKIVEGTGYTGSMARIMISMQLTY